MDKGISADNRVHIQVKDSEGKVLSDYEDHNDYCDDFLVCGSKILSSNASAELYPWCFLLPDGPKWTGFAFDRMNPWAPYCATLNNSLDNAADPLYASHATAVKVGDLWKLFYKWTQLPQNLSLKAVGLMGLEGNTRLAGARSQKPVIFNPLTLLVLPQPMAIKGRLGGTQTPDTLEISYFLGLKGV